MPALPIRITDAGLAAVQGASGSNPTVTVTMGLFSGALAFIVDAFLAFTPLGLLMRAFAPAIAYLRGLNFTAIGRDLIQGLINGIVGVLRTLKSTITGAASAVTTLFKEKLGIHSPSRVFAGLGGFVMAGLDQGLAANTSGPISRITDLSGQMTRALAVSAGTGAIAATGLASPAAAQGTAAYAAAAAGSGATYYINITVGAGGNVQDIAEEVSKAIEAIERDRKGRGFGDDGY